MWGNEQGRGDAMCRVVNAGGNHDDEGEVLKGERRNNTHRNLF